MDLLAARKEERGERGGKNCTKANCSAITAGGKKTHVKWMFLHKNPRLTAASLAL